MATRTVRLLTGGAVGLSLLLSGRSSMPVQAQLSQTIVIDHTTPLSQFDEMPQEIKDQVFATRFEFADASVGANVWEGFDIMARYANRADAVANGPNYAGTYALGTTPEDWNGPFPNQFTYNTYPTDPGPINPMTGCIGNNGIWTGKLPCWRSWLIPRLDSFDMVMFFQDYNSSAGPFGASLPTYYTNLAGDYDAYDQLNFEQLVVSAGKTMLWTNTSIVRGEGTGPLTIAPRLAAYNAASRIFAQANPQVFVDFGDIVSHCFDGTPTFNSQGVPVICADWTSNDGGGHLTYGSSRVRAAKYFAIGIARRKGWDPNGSLPLAVSCPADMIVGSTTNGPIVVTYQPATPTGGAQPVTLSYIPISGSVFPIGETNVAVTATDALGVQAQCSFTVTVQDVRAPDIAGFACTVVLNPQPPDAIMCSGAISGGPYGAGSATISIPDLPGNVQVPPIIVPVTILNP